MRCSTLSPTRALQVLALPEYMQWAASFGAAAQHIMARAGPSCGAVLRSSAAMQVPPHIFPLKSHSCVAAWNLI